MRGSPSCSRAFIEIDPADAADRGIKTGVGLVTDADNSEGR
jgi:hypothetical protein